MIIVFDNIIFSLQRAGGISAFWSKLIRGTMESGLFDCRFIEDDNARKNIFRRELKIPEEKIIHSRRLSIRSLLFAVKVPSKISRQPFIFHSSYYRQCIDSKAINVTTVHDFIHENGLQGSWVSRRVFSIVKRNVMSASRALICVSRTTRDELLKRYPSFGDKIIDVAYNAPVVRESASKVPKKGKEYLLFVGARGGYKHFMFACRLAAMERMKLVIAGEPIKAKERLALLKYWGLKYEVELRPDNKRMAQLYAGAHCLLYPSEMEGFGLPIVEAQSYGCPVLTMKRSAMPETGGAGALYLSDYDVRQGLELMRKLRNRSFRSKLVALGKQNVQRFSWENAVDSYIALYKRLAQESNDYLGLSAV